ncbi:lysozyme 2-like [Eurosta solidaginis]|uniref:lysozyme 2-like n=1 Tax=Eurosta solidaginis TaxID=178769 RepID=UPI0035312E64
MCSKMRIFVFFIFVLTLTAPIFGRILTRCSLAHEMLDLGVPKDELARWAYIAERESAFNTTAVGKTNTNGSTDYGLFQINSRYWCQPPDDRFSSNECAIDCADLLVDSISPSVTCSQQILRQQGWTAWAVWRFCNGTLPSIDDCFEA